MNGSKALTLGINMRNFLQLFFWSRGDHAHRATRVLRRSMGKSQAHFMQSVIEHKLRRIKQAPQHILNRSLPVRHTHIQRLARNRHLFGGRQA